ncbi:MAG: hypothetical protein ACKOUQ_04660, partial [Aquirufa sp.]
MKKISTGLLLFLLSFQAFSQDLFPHTQQKWVDSVFNSLSVDEKIGQLLMPRGNVADTYDTTRLYSIVKDY